MGNDASAEDRIVARENRATAEAISSLRAFEFLG
jgi:hypothetical protein